MFWETRHQRLQLGWWCAGQVGHGAMGTLQGKGFGHGQANAAGRTGEQSVFVLQSVGHVWCSDTKV